MLSLEIKTAQYNYLLQSYKEYLQILGYANPTVQSWPIHVRELLHWLETKSINQITTVESKHINEFISYIKRRKNKTRDGALSSSSINKIINAVNVFAKFLNSTGKYFLELSTHRAEDDIGERIILSIEEVKKLYEATFLPHRQNSIAIGQRDRAIIAIFYGCGLRRSEAKQLNITDIDLQKRLLFVRKGKGNKQRYVPIAAKHLTDIKDYLQEGREWFLLNNDTKETWQSKRHGTPLTKKDNADDTAFFVGIYGKRMNEFYQRLEQMKQRAELNKNITLHGLRHSIATHLLQSGMDIEEIAKFLGHSSLASTQIYTHIINEELKIKNDE
ncbi:MAG: tyrosine-type recombinase/integrase [Ferruginibacter sp.]